MLSQNIKTQNCGIQSAFTFIPVLVQPVLSLNCLQPFFNIPPTTDSDLHSPTIIHSITQKPTTTHQHTPQISKSIQFLISSQPPQPKLNKSLKPQFKLNQPLNPTPDQEDASRPTDNHEPEPKELKKTIWSQDEDRQILEMVSLFGKQWKHIEEQFPGRNSKQIRQRYLNYLRPNISHERWTPKEDEELIELVRKYGKHWNIIEKFITNRSQNQLKNRFYGKLKKIFDQFPNY